MAAVTRGLLTRLVQFQSHNSLLSKASLLNHPCVSISSLPVITHCRSLRSSALGSVGGVKFNAVQQNVRPVQETIENSCETELAITNEIINNVNTQINSDTCGRLFAIIHLAGKQFRVTDGDLIMIEGFYPTSIGDVIRLEKILLVGSKDFTLLGRPILRPDLVRVEATVIEKSLTHTKTHFRKKRRKQYMRINFYRQHFTIFRINCVRLEGLVDRRPEIEGVDGRVF